MFTLFFITRRLKFITFAATYFPIITIHIIMKKTIFLFTAIVSTLLCAHAQDKGQYFSSKQLNDAIETWKYTADNHKTDLHDWAKAVYQSFGLRSDSTIRHSYVINARDTFNIPSVMALTRIWFDKAFTTPGDTVIEYDAAKQIMKAKVTLVGQADAYGFRNLEATNSESHVTIPIDITIQFKENRLRYIAKIDHYILNSSDWVRDIVDQVTPIKESFPIDPKGKHRDSFSRAFINGNAKCLASCQDLINYYNTHFGDKSLQNKPKKQEDDDDNW